MHERIGVPSVEARSSWLVATVVLVILALSFGAPWITIVALKLIAAELGDLRSVPALATALAWIGFGTGGLVMGYVAERVGVRSTVIFGAVMICIGLALSTGGEAWQLYIGQGLFVGFFGVGGMNAPFYVYISRWFDRRRGSALALISSGSYVAGALWPPIFERAVAYGGWRQTMLYYGLLEVAVVVPLAAIFLRPPPELPLPVGAFGVMSAANSVTGWPPNLVFALMAAASIFCCVPMAIPQAHLPAFCSDLGILASHGAAMLSVLLGTAFVSRQFWGWVSDRMGGLNTVLTGSMFQIIAMAAFMFTQDKSGCSRCLPPSAWDLPGSFPLMCWQSESCFRRRRPTGASRRFSYAAAAAWRSGGGWRACSTITSVPMRRPSPPASLPMPSTWRSSACWCCVKDRARYGLLDRAAAPLHSPGQRPRR